MATRSMLFVWSPLKEQYRQAYVHYDGHPQTMLPLLEEHYGTPGDAMALAQLGDMRSVRSTLEECEPFEEDSIYPEWVEAVRVFLDGMVEHAYVYRYGGWVHKDLTLDFPLDNKPLHYGSL